MTESEVPLVVLLIALGAVLGWRVARRATPALDHARPRPSPRSLKPRTPQDCPDCRICPREGLPSRSPPPKPYPHVKSPRGCKKRLITAGYACPNPNCLYVGITDDRIHALVGCGHHGRHDRIQDLRCQACRRKFSVRLDTALYRLKTPARRVAKVLGALAEGVSIGAATRIFGHREFTVRTWLTRAGLQAATLHERVLRNLKLLQVQLDEICTRTRQSTARLWVGIALDAPTKLIPVLILGARTQSTAHALVRALIPVLAPGPLPGFTSDCGDWATPVGRGSRQWRLRASLLYGQLVKRYRRRRLVQVERQTLFGSSDDLSAALRAAGPSGLNQTAFIERLNLTVRQAVAALCRRTWGLAQSPAELRLHLEWWRAYYHFVRPHTSLSARHPDDSRPGKRGRLRAPAQAAELTDHTWTVLELLSFPLPKTAR